jgi:DNA polymerase-1
MKLKIIEKESEVDELIHNCLTTKYCSFDYETTGLEFHSENQYPLILGVSFQPGQSTIIPLGHKDSPFNKSYPKILTRFGKAIIQNPEIVKVAWNLKFEYKWSMRYDIIPKGRLFDAMLAKYCLDEERPHGLKNFVENFFPQYSGYEKALRHTEDSGDIKVDWKNTNYEELCKYCGVDSDLTLRAMTYMEPKLMKLGFYNLFRNMLMGITRCLAEAEYRGMLIDRYYLENLMKEYEKKITESSKSMKESPEVIKFERKQKAEHLQGLIKNTQLEIANLKNEDARNTDRLIANREAKIKGFLEGRFNSKEKKGFEGLNLASPKQLIEFLYTKKGLNLPILDYTFNKETKEETDTPSTAEETLKKLEKRDKTKFITKLLKHRALTKLDSTYVHGMYPHLDRYNRVHANYRVNGTVTGRLSCVEPNLQNIPRGSTAADIKRMFVPPPGYVLMEKDYGQAELRIIAELSGDEAMIEIFKKGYNIHTATACKMSGKGLKVYDKVKAILKIGDIMTAEELAKPENKNILKWVKLKKRGKSMNFSIVYQQGDDATAEQLEVSVEEARQFKKEWYAQFPGVEKWIKDTKRQAHKDEYVYNLFGGKRRLWNINSENRGKSAEAERQAINAPVQGASGYYTLFSIIIIREMQLRAELPRDMMFGYTVHDSLGYYVRPKDVHKVSPIIDKVCQDPDTEKYFGFKMKDVLMKISGEVGYHWAALKDYNPQEDYTKLLDI